MEFLSTVTSIYNQLNIYKPTFYDVKILNKILLFPDYASKQTLLYNYTHDISVLRR